MSYDATNKQKSSARETITVPRIVRKKELGEKITALTAYDYPMARLLDEAEIDIVLVGDSLGNAVLGYENTIPVTLDEILHHTKAVARGARHALVVADMPFGSYNVSVNKAVEGAVRCIKEGHAKAVKLEGGIKRAHIIKHLVAADIPVMGHIGLTPQSVYLLGGYKVRGKSDDEIKQLFEDAVAVQEAGAFSIVLESMPEEVAAYITAHLKIPTIGIGAGRYCDGQILVTHDLIGLSFGHTPKFVRKYADLSLAMKEAFKNFITDVRRESFPGQQETYKLPAERSMEEIFDRSGIKRPS